MSVGVTTDQKQTNNLDCLKRKRKLVLKSEKRLSSKLKFKNLRLI